MADLIFPKDFKEKALLELKDKFLIADGTMEDGSEGQTKVVTSEEILSFIKQNHNSFDGLADPTLKEEQKPESQEVFLLAYKEGDYPAYRDISYRPLNVKRGTLCLFIWRSTNRFWDSEVLLDVSDLGTKDDSEELTPEVLEDYLLKNDRGAEPLASFSVGSVASEDENRHLRCYEESTDKEKYLTIEQLKKGIQAYVKEHTLNRPTYEEMYKVLSFLTAQGENRGLAEVVTGLVNETSQMRVPVSKEDNGKKLISYSFGHVPSAFALDKDNHQAHVETSYNLEEKTILCTFSPDLEGFIIIN